MWKDALMVNGTILQCETTLTAELIGLELAYIHVSTLEFHFPISMPEPFFPITSIAIPIIV